MKFASSVVIAAALSLSSLPAGAQSFTVDEYITGAKITRVSVYPDNTPNSYNVSLSIDLPVSNCFYSAFVFDYHAPAGQAYYSQALAAKNTNANVTLGFVRKTVNSLPMCELVVINLDP